MRADPYINKQTGEIQWFEMWEGKYPQRMIGGFRFNISGKWQPYADFEREKLKELGDAWIEIKDGGFKFMKQYQIARCGYIYESAVLTDYGIDEYCGDSESGRLLKRAEFLKAVCEKEGVEFLPKEKCCHKTWGECGLCLGFLPSECGCSCHKKNIITESKCGHCTMGDPEKCVCHKKPEKPDNEGALQDVWNLDKCGTKDRTLVKHFEEEREWRGAFLDKWLEFARRTTRAKDAQALKDIEDLRRKFT